MTIIMPRVRKDLNGWNKDCLDERDELQYVLTGQINRKNFGPECVKDEHLVQGLMTYVIYGKICC